MFEGDPEILQDFLTESGELLESFDADLVTLESSPRDQDLLNKVFRALHTIKGSASFLSLKELVEVAHAAEEALNAARRGDFVIDRPAMDALLQAADVIRRQMDCLRGGRPLVHGDPALVAALTRLGKGGPAPAAARRDEPGRAAPTRAEAAATAREPAPEEPVVFSLPPHKADLLGLMVEDALAMLPALRAAVLKILTPESRDDGLIELGELSGEMFRSADFFECKPMADLVSLFEVVASKSHDLDESAFAQVAPRLLAASMVLEQQTRALGEGQIRVWDTETLAARVGDLVLGHDLEPSGVLPPGSDGEAAWRIDGVAPKAARAASSGSPPVGVPAAAAPAGGAHLEPAAAQASVAPGAAPSESWQGDHAKAAAAEGAQTIRVDVERLESLLDLVGELVLQKNRIGALARKVGASGAVDLALREQLEMSSGELDRVTGDLQLAVMRTRMQPLDKVFGRYPRLIRDLERATGKRLRLDIVGGETEVDKSVIELIGDPLVHLLRNSADHGIETPEARSAQGKAEVGTIRLSASAEGEHVLIEVSDDGAGLNREKILTRAVERGLVTPEAGAAMPDGEVFRFIFAPGFSTAEVVSDLSGRGVGMDVVNTNIQKMKGMVTLRSEAGRGTTVSIAIPLTLAILDAMVIELGEEEYSIPLSSIVEIVKPSPEQLGSIRDRSVMRLRDTVLPLIDGGDAFGVPAEKRGEMPFAVVLGINGKKAGLMVSRLVGQREIVVKSLEETVGHDGPISGVTVGEDGEAGLIIDVARLLERAAA